MKRRSIQAIIALAQTLDNNGEFEAADIIDSTIPEPGRKYDWSKLVQALNALEYKLTGRPRESSKNDNQMLEVLYGGQEYYLNDGGYSRLVLREAPPDYSNVTVSYTSNSTDRVKGAWDSAMAERQAVIEAANELYNDEAYRELSML